MVSPPSLVLAGPLTQWWDNNASALVEVPLRIVLLAVLAVVLRGVAGRLISRTVRRVVDRSHRKTHGGTTPDAASGHDERIASERRRQRTQTLGSILTSVASVVIFTVAGMLVLGEVGVSLGPIIASAGIIGLAVGFGAQSLVSDVVAGMFMLMEDQYGVGDWIDAGEASGTVEHVGLRVTELRDANGVLWFVRNGQIVRVGNHAQDWARALLEVPIAYHDDVDRAGDLLLETARGLRGDPEWSEAIIEDPELWGVSSLSREAVVLQLAVTTAPQQQWGVGRELRQRIKTAFDAHGVHIPLTQQVMVTSGTESGGNRQAAPSGHRH